MDKETADTLKAFDERISDLEKPVAIVSTAPFSVSYTVGSLLKRYEAPTIDELIKLIETEKNVLQGN